MCFPPAFLQAWASAPRRNVGPRPLLGSGKLALLIARDLVNIHTLPCTLKFKGNLSCVYSIFHTWSFCIGHDECSSLKTRRCQESQTALMAQQSYVVLPGCRPRLFSRDGCQDRRYMEIPLAARLVGSCWFQSGASLKSVKGKWLGLGSSIQNCFMLFLLWTLD